MPSHSGKNVLITFGRSFLTLTLSRLLAAGGHQVFVADSIRLPVSRFSNAVAATFHVAPPTFEPVRWAHDMARIVRERHIDQVITMHEETNILAQVLHRYPGLFPESCELFLSDFEDVVRLDNKYAFQALLESLGVPTLRYAQVADQAELEALDFDGPYALKQCYSRGSQQVLKVLPGEVPQVRFDPLNPWFAQEWAEGERYCSYSVCRNGEVRAHALYPVQYAIDGRSCLYYEQVAHEPIARWVRERVKDFNFTGQIGFDFIDVPGRGLVTIECNPRATSGILLFEPGDGVDSAFVGPPGDAAGAPGPVLSPRLGTRKILGPGMFLYGWRASSLPGNTLRGFLRDVRAADGVIFARGDRLPGFAVPIAVANIARQGVRYRVGLAEAFMHDHEWDGTGLPDD